MCVIFEQEVVNEKIIEKFKVLTPFLKLTNALEAFSMYFTKDVGDEEIAFSSVGRTFCVNVGYLVNPQKVLLIFGHKISNKHLQ